MDLLTIDTSILGLLKATALVARYLAPYVSAARDTPKIVSQVHSEVVYTRTILIAIESLTSNLASIPARRAALITIDQLIAVFTDGVLLLSELEATLPSLPSTETISPRLPLQSRLQWARKESVFVAFLTRLQGFKASISLMLNILQSDSDLRAAEHQLELSQNVAALLESNHSLTRRLMNLEDAFEVRSIVSKRQSRSFNIYNGINNGTSIGEEPNIESTDSTIARANNTSQLSTPPDRMEVSGFDFENDLGASRVYRRAQRDTMDFSFRSSIAHTNAWSIFLGLSLSDISIISAIALPLYPEEIENAQHYGLAGPQTVLDTAPASHSPRVRSLYQECVEVELRLTKIPGFPEIFTKLRDEGEDHDPLSLLITFFRRGAPLLMLLERVPGLGNLDYLTELWYIDSQKVPKVATYKFINACIHDLGFQPDECFSIGDLMGSNSTGFVNVVKVVTRLLDILTNSGEIEPVDLATIHPEREGILTNPLTPRDAILEGFLVDDRSYLSSLEGLLELKTEIESEDALRSDILHPILSSLDPIVDGQRRFLLRMEMTARKPSDQQMWAVHFDDWSRMSSLYASFITSEKEAREHIRTVLAERQGVEDNYLHSVLRDSLRLLFLPSQRLPKYSGFLQELHRQGGLSRSQMSDVSAGIEALQNALRDINTAMKCQELREAQADLVARVRDWKGHNIKEFGDLLQFDFVNVVTGKYGTAETYRAYLYERILIFFMDTSRPRRSTFRRVKNTEPDTRTITQVKGRIVARIITSIIYAAKPGSYTCQIWWKEDSDVYNIIMKFPTESKMKTWYQELQGVKDRNAIARAGSPSTAENFAWIMKQRLTNPYAAGADAEDMDDGKTDVAPHPPPPRFLMKTSTITYNTHEGNWL